MLMVLVPIFINLMIFNHILVGKEIVVNIRTSLLCLDTPVLSCIARFLKN